MDRRKPFVGLAFVLIGGALLLALLAAVPAEPPGAVDSPWIGPWIWEVRGLDVAVQALLVLAGVLGVLLVLGPGREPP